jgi:hypothetical protein
VIQLDDVWTKLHALEITKTEAWYEAFRAWNEARATGLLPHRLHYIKRRARMYWFDAMKFESKRFAEKFSFELRQIVGKNIRAIRRKSLTMWAKGEMFKTYQRALRGGLIKQDALKVCNAIAKKYKLFSGAKLLEDVKSYERFSVFADEFHC